MSTIIPNLEPQAHGLISFKTNFGDLDIELFTKECPKACKNFVQLCLDRFYEDTIFERVEKDFIAVGGTRKEGQGEEEYFKDEFHPRLRFTRRGLLATANTDQDANGSKFFFTLGPAPELQNKHTIFGRLKGNAIYTLVDLNECLVDEENLCPLSEKRIIEVIVKENPYPELIARVAPKKQADNREGSEEEDDYDPFEQKYKLDRKTVKKLSFYADDDVDDDDDDDSEDDSANSRSSPQSSKQEKNDLNRKESNAKPQSQVETQELVDKEQQLRKIKAQFEELKQQIESSSETLSERRKKATVPKVEEASSSANDSKNSLCSSMSAPYIDDSSATKLRIAAKKNRNRERETLELLANFKKKLKEAKSQRIATSSAHEQKQHELNEPLTTASTTIKDYSPARDFELDDLDKVDNDDWLSHTFIANDDEFDDTKLAKDASAKRNDWCKLDDPRKKLLLSPKSSSSASVSALGRRSSREKRAHDEESSDRHRYRSSHDNHRHRHERVEATREESREHGRHREHRDRSSK